VVKGTDVEMLAEGLLRPGARLEDGALAQVVRQRLARPGDVAIDLGGDLALRQRGVLAAVIDGLLPRPALRMKAGVDHQTCRAPDLVAEHTEALVGRVVHAHLAAELLTVQRPAFTVG